MIDILIHIHDSDCRRVGLIRDRGDRCEADDRRPLGIFPSQEKATQAVYQDAQRQIRRGA